MLKHFTTVVQEVEITLQCRHASEWPPVHARLDEPLESQRARGLISEHKYQQVQVWERVCGLKEMGTKCLRCPFSESSVYRALLSFIPKG